MKRLIAPLLIAGLIFGAIGCGGGGGGSIRLTGRVLSVSTGGAPNPQATAQIGNSSVLTEAGSGVFILNVAPGASILIVTHPVFPTFTFVIPPAVANADLGDFWIGPQQVRVDGSVLDVQTNLPLEGVSIRFAGHRAITDVNGEFSINGVAYDPDNDFVFFGIVGLAQKAGYVPAEFTANQDPVGGVVTLLPILMAPVSDPNPPGPPFNLWGIVTVQGGSPTGTVVTLLQSGNPFRLFNVGSDGRYTFWAPPAVYVLRFEKNGYQTVEVNVDTFTSPDQVIRNDVTLIPEP